MLKKLLEKLNLEEIKNEYADRKALLRELEEKPQIKKNQKVTDEKFNNRLDRD